MITAIQATQRLDSKGNPTVQVWVTTNKGTFRALVPSGASKGEYEATIIAQKFNVAKDLADIDALMRKLDGTVKKSNLGANAILGVSMACTRAAAADENVPLYGFIRQQYRSWKPYILPTPFFNVLNGGVHSGSLMAFQGFMIPPIGAKSMAHAVQMGSEVCQALKGVIKTKFGVSAIGIGDEGGFAPPISKPHGALDLLVTAVDNCGYTGRVKFAIDPASSEFPSTTFSP